MNQSVANQPHLYLSRPHMYVPIKKNVRGTQKGKDEPKREQKGIKSPFLDGNSDIMS